MVSEIDVSGISPEQARDEIVESFEGSKPGDEVRVVADQHPETALSLARIKHDRVLEIDEPDQQADDWTGQVRVTDQNRSEPIAFDVRELPPQQRHAILTDTFDRLDPGEGFVLVNDHDPKPLYHELRSMHGDVVDWEYRSRESGSWRVEIEKTAAGETTGEDVAASFDVREIPKEERHPTIHHRYSNLSAGDVLEVIAPHEPRPLKNEFRDQYGEDFDWEIQENEPGRCRVWITKRGSRPDEGDAAPEAQSEEELTIIEELDVREFPPAKRHELIFEAYDDLEDGEAFVLVNDHDPKPLYHQFDAEAGEEFSWEYQQQDAGEFRVRIGKSEVEESARSASTNFDAPF